MTPFAIEPCTGDSPTDLTPLPPGRPAIAPDRAAAVDSAYADYCTRVARGERIDVEAYCARFPFAADLRDVLNLHQFLTANPTILDRLTRSWPAPGERLGDFLLVGRLGRGASARVYLGRELTAGGRPVVLKVTDAATPDAEVLGPLSHPHLIPVLSSPRIEPWSVVVMPFLGAATLENVLSAAWLAGRPAPRTGKVVLDVAAGVPADAPPVTAQPPYSVGPKMPYESAIGAIAAGLFAGLAYLHAAGIAHRDLKPSNVLLGPTGHPYLLDFNLATTSRGRDGPAGTPAYMAPEQLRLLMNKSSHQPTDWRPADVFACGVMLFQLLTGRHPYLDETAGQPKQALPQVAAGFLDRLRAGRLHSLANFNPRVRRSTTLAIERCLQWDPARRPTARDLADLLAPRPRRTTGRRSLLAFAGLAALSPGLLWLRTPTGPVASQSSSPAVAVPSDPMDRGIAYYRMGENGYGLAAAEFMKSASDRKDGKTYALAAYCFSLAKDHRSAILAAKNAEKLGFATTSVYANRAYSHFRLAEFEDAMTACEAALKADPGLRAARYTRAVIHLQVALLHDGNPPPAEAIDDVNFALSGSPEPADLWYTAAHLYVLAGQERPAMLDAAAVAVREAVRAGQSPAAMKRNPHFERLLRDNPVYREALTLIPSKEHPADHIQLVNPEPDLLISEPQS